MISLWQWGNSQSATHQPNFCDAAVVTTVYEKTSGWFSRRGDRHLSHRAAMNIGSPSPTRMKYGRFFLTPPFVSLYHSKNLGKNVRTRKNPRWGEAVGPIGLVHTHTQTFKQRVPLDATNNHINFRAKFASEHHVIQATPNQSSSNTGEKILDAKTSRLCRHLNTNQNWSNTWEKIICKDKSTAQPEQPGPDPANMPKKWWNRPVFTECAFGEIKEGDGKSKLPYPLYLKMEHVNVRAISVSLKS